MWLQHSSSLFVFWIPFSLLSNFVTSTQIDDDSTNILDDADDDDGLIFFVVCIFLAILLPCVIWAIVSLVFAVAGTSRNDKFEDVKFCNL